MTEKTLHLLGTLYIRLLSQLDFTLQVTSEIHII